MIPRTTLAVAFTALVGTSYALSHRRHAHQNRHLHRHQDRALHVEWETVYVTVTVTAGAEGPDETQVDFKVNHAPQASETPAAIPEAKIDAPSPAAPAPAAPATDNLIIQVTPAAAVPVPEVPAAVPPEAYVPSGGSKRGWCYNDANLINSINGNSNFPWAYNWDSNDNGLSAGGIDYVPMIWGDIPVHTERWDKNVKSMIAKGSKTILSFNEPDHPEQAHMSAGQAASSHVRLVNPYCTNGIRCGSPAITNSNLQGQGLDWLKDFIPACDNSGCKIDFCVTHWYGPANTADLLFEHLQKVHELCHNKPVWLTEFAPFGSDAEIAGFLQDVLPKLDGLGYVERYSYFMASIGSLLSSPNSLSTFGQKYVTI